MNKEKLKRKTNKEYLQQVLPFFEKAFINKECSDDPELILEPKNNIYFRLSNIDDDLDFDAKMLAYLLRPACKDMNKYWEKYFRRGLFSYFRKTWENTELDELYTYLGNDIRREKARAFILSNFDMNIIYEIKKEKNNEIQIR